MKLIDLWLGELEREGERSKRVLQEVLPGKADWKPHERSMTFGYLATLVATMPNWISLAIDQPSLDLNPPGGGGYRPGNFSTAADYVAGLHDALEKAKHSLRHTTEDHLNTDWKLLVAGNVVMTQQRHVVVRETINHWAHHRGQMTVFLRLLDLKVPALYGPSADDKSFGVS
jgi:hypothetical protein